jgi:hypothetical protein
LLTASDLSWLAPSRPILGSCSSTRSPAGSPTPKSWNCRTSSAALQGDGIAVLWIEHVVRALLSTVDRLLCLANGALVADGEPKEVLASDAVRTVYLGGRIINESGIVVSEVGETLSTIDSCSTSPISRSTTDNCAPLMTGQLQPRTPVRCSR